MKALWGMFVSSVAFAQLWVQPIGGDFHSISSIAVDERNNCFVSGILSLYTTNQADFGTTNLPPGPFFAQYDPRGNLVFARQTDHVRLLATVGMDLVGVEGSEVFQMKNNGTETRRTSLESPAVTVTDLSPCDARSFVIAGSFQQYLTIGKQTLIAADTNAISWFTARLSMNGQVVWMREISAGSLRGLAGIRNGGAYVLTTEPILENDVLVGQVFTVQAFGESGDALWMHTIPGDNDAGVYAIA